jgi:septal ring-binding cell division protein DamX
LARQQARRQQRERAIGIVVVCLGVVVLIVAVAALREPAGHVSKAASSKGSASSVAKQTQTKSPSRPPAKTRTSSSTRSSTDVKRTPLVVLNNTTIKGLASEAAQRFENGGWTVTDSGNLTNEILSTCAYYDESDPQAKRAAEALRAQYPVIKRVEPKFPELPDGPVVVVLTPDYSTA